MLDSQTEKGIKYIEQEDKIADTICEKLRCEQIHMASNDCQVDRLFFRGKTLVSIGEIKSRNMSLEELKEHGSYLISYKKLQMGKAFCDLTGVPYFLFVKLIPDNEIYFWKICDDEGNWTANFETKETVTKSNVNGGSATRINAFIELDQMKRLE
tara:strand:+ start:4629 stop:5093 length:465 start_codon:yes stop_codon:yes gene_type:complete